MTTLGPAAREALPELTEEQQKACLVIRARANLCLTQYDHQVVRKIAENAMREGIAIGRRTPPSPTAQESGDVVLSAWISVEDRLPPLGQWVSSCRAGESGSTFSQLLRGADGEEKAEWMGPFGHTTVTSHAYLPPTHWAPLPRPIGSERA